jgi:PAS domain S-box-containing protein
VGLERAITLQTVTSLLAVLFYGALIYAVARHGLRGNRLNQVFSLYLLTMVLWQLAYLMVTLSANAEQALFWYSLVVAVVSGQFVVYFVFIRTLLRIRAPSTLVYLGLLVWGLTVVWVLLGKEPSMLSGIRRDQATSLFVPTFGPLLPFAGGVHYFFLACAMFYLVRGYRTTKSPLQRSRIQYLVLGFVVVLFGTMANFEPRLQPYPVDVGANIVNAFVIAYAIYRYQLLNIRLVVRKGLLYSILTAVIGFAYFLTTFLTVSLFHPVAGYQLVLSLIIGALTAVVVEPLRSRVQSWIDRFFFREQYDASRMLQDLSRTSAAVLNQDQLTGMILDAVISTMHIGRAVLFLKQEGSGEFQMVSQRGLGDSAVLRLRRDHPVVYWLNGHDGILTRRDMELLPVFKALWGQEEADLDTIGAELFIPLKVKDALVGIFAVGSKLSQEAYSQADQLTLTTLANQTAVAVANARLYSAEQRRVKESRVLLDIAAAVGSTLDLTEILKFISRRTAEVCQVHRCSIFLLDAQRQSALPLMSQLASGETDEELWKRFRYQTYVQQLDQSPIFRAVIRDRQPLVLGASELEALPGAWVAPFTISSVLIVPLIARDQVIGAMALDQVEPGKRFSDEQINLAMTLGSQTAAAIENARLHEQTIKEKARAEAILQETFSGIVVVDERLRIVSMNPGAELITGYLAEEVVGRRVDTVFGLEMGGPDSPLTCAFETGADVLPLETMLTVRHGSKDVLLGVTPLPAGNQPSKQCLLSFTDVTKLKEVDRLRSSIVANVSHELRTPLASIKAYTELLLVGADEDDGKLRQEWLAVISQETDRVTALVSDMLNLARLESEHVELVKEPLDLAALIADVVASFRVQLERRNLVLALTVQPDLPKLLADRGLIEILVRNLVDNAVKFSQEGGHVRVMAWHGDDHVSFLVEDDGMGIPEDALPQLFTKFFRVPSTDAAAVQGTGLGLALAKEAAAVHGGRIEVKSTLGQGSQFTVILPRNNSVSSEADDVSSEGGEGAVA